MRAAVSSREALSHAFEAVTGLEARVHSDPVDPALRDPKVRSVQAENPYGGGRPLLLLPLLGLIDSRK